MKVVVTLLRAMQGGLFIVWLVLTAGLALFPERGSVFIPWPKILQLYVAAVGVYWWLQPKGGAR